MYDRDGLIDPRRRGPADLLLALNRLAWIEELAPHAMDQVDGDAFQEADKDLVDLVLGMAR
jgi:hypothetical protein